MNRTVREYLHELEQENPVEAPVAQQEQVSTTEGGPPLRFLQRWGAVGHASHLFSLLSAGFLFVGGWPGLG